MYHLATENYHALIQRQSLKCEIFPLLLNINLAWFVCLKVMDHQINSNQSKATVETKEWSNCTSA